jgi:hypothetical protein
VPGIKGLSFADDIAWWAEGQGDQEVAAKLSVAAAASLERATNNGVAFDQGKTEMAFFQRKGPTPTATGRRKCYTLQQRGDSMARDLG